MSRLRADIPVPDADFETAGLFGVHRRLDFHAAADTGAVRQTDDRRRHGPVQVPAVGVHHEHRDHVRTDDAAVLDTGLGVRRRNERYGRDLVAGVLVLFRHHHADQLVRNHQQRPGRHYLHEFIRYTKLIPIKYRKYGKSYCRQT